MEKVDNMEDHMGNVSSEMKIPRKNKKEMLETRNTVTKMKNYFDRFTYRWDMTEESVSELQAISIETSKIKKQRGKNKTENMEQNI